jgi:hypothetical protein
MGGNAPNNLVLCAIGLMTECSIENFGCILYHADVDSNALFTLFEDKAQQKFFNAMNGRFRSWMEQTRRCQNGYRECEEFGFGATHQARYFDTIELDEIQ